MLCDLWSSVTSGMNWILCLHLAVELDGGERDLEIDT